MKKFTFLIAAILVSAASFAQNFEVKVNIKGLVSQKAFVHAIGNGETTQIDYSDPAKETIDIKDGKFTVKGTVGESIILRMYFPEDKQLMKLAKTGAMYPCGAAYLYCIVSPETKARIKGDITGKDQMDIYPDFDEQNRIMAELHRKVLPLDNENGNLKLKLFGNRNVTAEEKAAGMETLKANSYKIYEITHEFVQHNAASVAGLWKLAGFVHGSAKLPDDEIASLLEKAKPQYGDTHFYKTVLNKIQADKNAKEGVKCIDIHGTDQNGKEISLKDFQGKYVILDFWGTWCGACIGGMPHMKAFRDKHAGKLEILGVANDKSVEKWKKCIADKGMDWPNIMQGSGDRDYTSRMNVQGFPTKFLIGKDGTILLKSVGEDEEFYQKTEEIMNR